VFDAAHLMDKDNIKAAKFGESGVEPTAETLRTTLYSVDAVIRFIFLGSDVILRSGNTSILR